MERAQGIAGYGWPFKGRYFLTVILPENLSVNRAAALTKLDRFLCFSSNAIEKYGLIKKRLLWNPEKADSSCIIKLPRVVFPKGLERVYQQTAAEKGGTMTAC